MPKSPRLTSKELEAMLLQGGFRLERTKGSHKIYIKGAQKIVIPFHAGKTLHPKIIKKALDTLQKEK